MHNAGPLNGIQINPTASRLILSRLILSVNAAAQALKAYDPVSGFYLRIDTALYVGIEVRIEISNRTRRSECPASTDK